MGDSINGGLVFLNSGVKVARPVTLNTTTRIVCNGTDSNTISGAIFGSGGLVKDGTGTLTITNANNSFAGGVTVTAGTLSLGTTGGLQPLSAVTVNGGGTYIPRTIFTNTTITTLTLNGGTFAVPSNTNRYTTSTRS